LLGLLRLQVAIMKLLLREGRYGSAAALANSTVASLGLPACT
jgi:hypothetical protein